MSIEKKIKFSKLRRELTSVSRWNLCQKIAKLLYATDLSEKDFMDGVKELVRYINSKNK